MGPGTAEGQKGEIADIETAFDRKLADRLDHAGIGNTHDAQRSSLKRESQWVGNIILHGFARQVGIKRNFATPGIRRDGEYPEPRQHR